MQGTLINTMAIIMGSLVGVGLKGGIPDQYKETVIGAIGLSVLLIGAKSALQTDALLLVIVSLALGSLAGEMLRIENRLERLGRLIGRRLAGSEEGVANAFVTASLVFCVGAMAVVGSLESGLTGNHQTLYAKSLLDGVTSIVFASTLGIGVVFSALAVLIYQGGITLSAAYLKPFLTPTVIEQMTAVGGLLILAIGFNILGFKRLRIGNMLPAIAIPLIYDLILTWLGRGA
ncbi:MAG: DUF554 domain-containing protein [Desulfobacterales bacterium]|nr:DUF554 domain-containing protein [Desulfobacterales bacterium]MDJ0874001.1 DUF554 domain-containing protein [Desulfobacterales bacterium]